jgi:hypothetical protein
VAKWRDQGEPDFPTNGRRNSDQRDGQNAGIPGATAPRHLPVGRFPSPPDGKPSRDRSTIAARPQVTGIMFGIIVEALLFRCAPDHSPAKS